jgi:hypothetical protein
MQRRLAVLLALGACLAVPVATASAATVATASAATVAAAGNFFEGPANYLSDTMVGADEVLTLTRDVTFDGTYDGPAKAFQLIVIHPDGTGDVKIAIHFEGLACGKRASLVFLITGTTNLIDTVTGRYVVLDHGQVRGSGRFDGVPDVGGTYQGTARC